MKRSYFFLYIILTLLAACNKKEPIFSDKNTHSISKESVTESGILHISRELLLAPPYPTEMRGIWGNASYLNGLFKYNSIGKVLEFVKFDTDIKIGRELVLSMRPQYGEPAEFDTTKYTLLKVGLDSLFVRSKNTGDKQLYVKIMNLPDSILWNLYEDESYSAISHMEWIWFQGKYNLEDKNTSKKEISFSKTGSIDGMEYDFYTFGVDVDGKDYLYLGSDKNNREAFFLIEYQQDGSFNCYNIEEIEDWEYPFVKSTFAFKLTRIK